jgi:hypothetical protein
MLPIGETGLLGSVNFTRATLLLVVAYNVVGGITAVRSVALPASAAASLGFVRK